MSFSGSVHRVSSAKSKSQKGNSKEQLLLLFDYIGKSFGKEISNLNEATTVIGKFVKKYLDNLDALEQYKEENDNLISKSTMGELEIDDRTKNEEILTRKLRNYKKKVVETQDESTKKNDKIHELVLELGKAKTEIKDLKANIETLEKEKEASKQVVVEKVVPVKQDASKTVALFEDLVLSQEETIQKLSARQTQLINIIHSYDQISSEFLTKLGDANTRNEEAKKQIEVLKKEAEKLANEKENSMNQLNEEIPDEIKDEINGAENPAVAYIQKLKQELEEKPKVIVQEAQIDKSLFVDKKKYVELIYYLEDSLALLKSATEGAYNMIGEETKGILLTQCARVGSWIDCNLSEIGYQNIPKQYSIFDPEAVAGPKEQLEVFLNVCTEEEMQKSPIKELFTVFSGVCDVNAMLLKHIQGLSRNSAGCRAADVSSELLKRIQNDNMDLIQENETLKAKVDSHEQTIRGILGRDDVDFENVIEDAQKVTKENEEKITTLRSIIEENTKEYEEKEKTNKELEDSLQITTNENENLKRTCNNQNKKLSELTSMYEKIKAEAEAKENENKSLREEFNEKTKKYKSTIKEYNKMKSTMNAIQGKMNKIISDNENLADSYIEIREKCEMQEEQLIAMAEVEEKLRASRDKLKQRLIKLKKQNETLIQSEISKVENM